MMEKNTIFAFLLIAAILILTPYYLEYVSPPPTEPEKRGEVVKPDFIEPAPAIIPKPLAVEPQKQLLRKPPTESIEEEIITVRTDLYVAKISSRNGGSLQSFTLNNYTMTDSWPVELINNHNKNNLLISALSIDGDPLILDHPWKNETLSAELAAFDAPQTLQFTTTVLGQPVWKTLTFSPGTYQIDIQVDLTAILADLSQSSYSISWTGGLPSTEKNKKDDLFYFKSYVYQGGEIDDDTKLNDKEFIRRKLPGSTAWVASRTKYFITALIPSRSAVGAEVGGLLINSVPTYDITLNSDVQSNKDITLYLGPLEYKKISSLGVDLDRTMTLGWAPIRPISRGILALLMALHKFVPNYGVVLIIFSVLVKIVVYPLTKKTYQSSRKMQEIQPLVTELKEKYKKDPQKMNKATMALYKEKGVNPLGGCLPLLLQMPLLIALFQVFRSTIELRGEPFVLWITDLSAPDTLMEIAGFPINILPLIMTASMLLQQKMMPTTQTAGQQKSFMYIMNFVFLFIFYRFPSGLNLYYTLFNVLTILQQKLLTPHTPAPTVPAKKPLKK